MNGLELVEVGHTRHDLGELEDIDESMKRSEIASGLTNPKRFASGWDLAYSITFPPGIHSVRMRKQHGSADIETPNKGRMFG